MKNALALLAAALLLLTAPALSLAHGRGGHDDGPRGREHSSWVKKGVHDAQRGRHRDSLRPAKHWKKHHRDQRHGGGWDDHRCRPVHYRDRVILGLPSFVFHMRW